MCYLLHFIISSNHKEFERVSPKNENNFLSEIDWVLQIDLIESIMMSQHINKKEAILKL